MHTSHLKYFHDEYTYITFDLVQHSSLLLNALFQNSFKDKLFSMLRLGINL